MASASQFPEFKEITLNDKKLFDGYLSRFQPDISELTFTNLFCWRHGKKHSFSAIGNHLLVSLMDNGRRRFYQPIGYAPEKVIADILGKFPDSSFERVDKKVAERIGGFAVKEDRDMSDYIYNVSDLALLKGDRYSAKRNFIKRCLGYTPEAKLLDKGIINSCLELQEKWCNINNCHLDKKMHAEDIAVKEALLNFEELKLSGIAVKIRDKVEAFAIGEPLSKNTFIEHFEKANTAFTGLYQYVLNEFAKHIPQEFAYLNREQDLGIEGLRKAKMGYHPVRLIDKCRVEVKRAKIL